MQIQEHELKVGQLFNIIPFYKCLVRIFSVILVCFFFHLIHCDFCGRKMIIFNKKLRTHFPRNMTVGNSKN